MTKNKNISKIINYKLIVFDFDGVFTDNKVYLNEDGKEFIKCSRADGMGIDLLRAYIKINQLNIDYIILSSETNPVVLARAKKLNIVAHASIKNKYKFILNFFESNFPEITNPFSSIVYLGNDLNDLPVMRHAGLSIVPGDAHPMVKAIASKVYPQMGGDGFVRAFIEDFININNLTEGELDDLIFNC